MKAFEEAFAAYVGAKFAIALNSGTSTLHTALVALGVQPGLTREGTKCSALSAGQY